MSNRPGVLHQGDQEIPHFGSQRYFLAGPQKHSICHIDFEFIEGEATSILLMGACCCCFPKYFRRISEDPKDARRDFGAYILTLYTRIIDDLPHSSEIRPGVTEMAGPKLSQHHDTLLRVAETLEPSPIPTRWVSNGEYMPLPCTRKQQQAAEQLKGLAEQYSRRLGVSRRDFSRGPCGLVAAFLAMNAVHGEIYSVNAAEAQRNGLWAARGFNR